MEQAIRKAAVLIEALPYIQRFRSQVIVIKFGGSAMENSEHSQGILTDVAFMECVGMCPVVVHGGGREISGALKQEGLKSEFVRGLRVTCERTMEVVERILKQKVNPRIVELLKQAGADAAGLDGDKVFEVERKREKDEVTGKMIDWGYVGEPVNVNTGPIMEMLNRKTIPAITPIGRGADGKPYNINADTAAAMTAKALKAAKLVFLSDVPGLLRDPNDPASIIGSLNESQMELLVERGVVAGGMLPKVRGGVDALHAGVKKVHMIDGRMAHSLLLEIFTDKGVGTEIVHNERQ